MKSEYQRKQWQKKLKATGRPLTRCRICNLRFLKVCSHVRQVHGFTARKYKELFGLPLKRGVIKNDLRKTLANHAKRTGTIKNLEKGYKTRFKTGISRKHAISRYEKIRTLRNYRKMLKRRGEVKP